MLKLENSNYSFTFQFVSMYITESFGYTPGVFYAGQLWCSDPGAEAFHINGGAIPRPLLGTTGNLTMSGQEVYFKALDLGAEGQNAYFDGWIATGTEI